jgi:hypothetical protein
MYFETEFEFKDSTFLDSHMELQIMYAGTKMALQREANLTRVYEVRELDEMTDEWLQDCVMGK